MRQCSKRCVNSPDSILAMAIGASRSFWLDFEMSADRAYRLWRQAGLQVPRRRPRRRIAGGRPRPTPPTVANHVWAYDFVYDRCANGEQLKCLTVVDEWTRECLAIQVSGSIRSRHVIEVLAGTHGAPRYLRRTTALSSSLGRSFNG